jgi:flagellar biosynthesis protein FliQ
MFTAYIVVTVLAAIANTFSATLDFVRYPKVLIAMAKAGVSESWLLTRQKSWSGNTKIWWYLETSL